MESFKLLGRSLRLKRLLDVVVASTALLTFGPLMIYLAFRVWRELGSPVLFRQVRPGLGGKPFVMYKFRTMTEEGDEQGNLLPDEKRLTPFGAFLRAWSLDELPELFNVLKGDMSLVGPRPLLMQYLDRYTPGQFRRHEVKPGITGWAQIHGRNALTWEEKFKLDVWYVDNWNIWLDLKILLLTLIKALKRDGISAPGHATMPEFRGNLGCEAGYLGGWGHAKVVLSLALDLGYQVLGLLDDEAEKWGQNLMGFPVAGPLNRIWDFFQNGAVFVLAIGDNAVRKKLAEEFQGVPWAT